MLQHDATCPHCGQPCTFSLRGIMPSGNIPLAPLKAAVRHEETFPRHEVSRFRFYATAACPRCEAPVELHFALDAPTLERLAHEHQREAYDADEALNLANLFKELSGAVADFAAGGRNAVTLRPRHGAHGGAA